MQTKEEQRKKRMSVVMMMIIMIMCFLLMVTEFTIENSFDRIYGESSNTPKTPTKVEALFTIVTAKDLNFLVTRDQMSKENVGDESYIDIRSDTVSSYLALRSKKYTTRCYYDVVINVQKNTFENKYMTNSGLKELDNQLILHLDGYQANSDTVAKSYLIDVNKIQNNELIIENVAITNSANSMHATAHSWNIGLIFKNYRDYNQTNNAGKEFKSTMHYRVTNCEMIEK